MKSEQKYSFTADSIFGNNYIDAKRLYMYYFNAIPNEYYIGNIDGEKGFTFIKEKFGTLITSSHTYRFYDQQLKKFDFNETYLVLSNKVIIEFDTGYCEIYHDGSQHQFVEECIAALKTFKAKKRRKPLEINLVIRNNEGLILRGMEIKRSKLNIDMYYEDDFKQVDEQICNRLNKNKDKGIVLLHGLPGTGKTTYLRYLVGKIKKRILFLSPSAATNLMDPEFVQLIINNPNTVLVIEDAENIIMDRKVNGNASVSNLLNISDGLLADFLNVQIICTFNSSIALVDEALLRKGRLIARYEFGKLSVAKAQRLSDYLGFQSKLNKPMTIAEISNQNEPEPVIEKMEVIGFRRGLSLMN